jgi:5-methylcytosine-specific restriction endonuclease McrA
MTERQEFTPRTKAAAFKRAGGCCEECGRKLGVGGEPCEFDHKVSCEDGGDNSLANCQCLCAQCHGHKTHKIEAPAKAEGRRHTLKMAGVKKKPRNPIPGSKASGWKRTIDGRTVRR